LRGLPVGIKDIIDVAGMTTLANSMSRANTAATADVEIVAALRLAGIVILGKTHMTEFAYFDPSPARNPHNIAHTPGGARRAVRPPSERDRSTARGWHSDRRDGQLSS
jgi:Asp-tRNA(Asn)/Glu-tRNA(Gln) amidotransferase A subunit family amidase